MNNCELAIIEGEPLALLPERAVFWPRQETLIVADVHVGKGASFRAAGIPVPGGATADDLTRLSRVLDQAQARRLILLGDFIHAKAGRTEAVLAAVAGWRARHPQLEIDLVRGNHDRHAGDPPEAWNIRCVDEPLLQAPFAFRHYPELTTKHYTLAGHLHPAVALAGPGRQKEKLPCFYFGDRVGMLPAFGSFTGTAVVRPTPSDRVYVVVGSEVIRI